MRKTTLALLTGLIACQLSGKEATLLYDGYHFRVPVEFDRSNKILLDPSMLPENMFIQDFGLKKTIPYKGTKITFIQGDSNKPRLFHRGKSIEELVETMSFSQMTSFLIFDNTTEYQYTPEELPVEIQNAMYLTIKSTHHPADFFPAFLQILALDQSLKSEKEIATYLLNVMPSYAAWSCQILSGKKDNIKPKTGTGISVAENFIYMYMGDKFENLSPKIQKAFVQALEAILVVHADHGVNASTATVRNAASVGAGLVSSISAGCEVLFGSLHGAANQDVIVMLRSIGSRENVLNVIEKAKSKENGFRLTGFGHRVYKGPDPRARIIKQRVIDLISLLKEENYTFSQDIETLLDTALELEKAASKDPYFKERGIYPNVDFYAGILYQLIGLPSKANTIMFALARLSGWIAHWFEQNANPTPIIRPRIAYTGNILKEDKV